MSYMYLLLAKDGDPNKGLRLMDAPAEWRSGAFVLTGDLEDRPAPEEDLWGMLDESAGDDYPMPAADIPNGWSCVSHFWQPIRYVPASAEVRDQARRDAIQKLKDMGIWRDRDA